MREILRLLSFLRRFSRDVPWLQTRLLVVLVAGAVGGATNVGLLAAINHVLAGGEASRGWIAAFVGLCVALPASRLTAALLQIHVAEALQNELRLRLTRQVLASELERLVALGPQRLLVALTHDVATVAASLHVLPGILLQLMTILGCLAYLVWLSPPLSGLVLLALVIGLPTFVLPMLRGMRLLHRSRDQWNGVFQLFQGVVEGIKELTLHAGRRRAFVDETVERNERFRRLSASGKSIYSAANVWGQLLFFVLIGVLLALFAGRGELGSTVAIGYCLTLLYMMAPLQILLTTAPRIAQGAISRRKLEELALAALPPADEGRPALPEPEPPQHIELCGVGYRYPGVGEDAGFAVGPIDLTLTPGEVVFLVGGNGSGKTTLLHLATGLLRPTRGEIRVDGDPVAPDDRDGYRQLFSSVFQEFHLFDRLYGLERPDLDRTAGEWLQRLHLGDKVEVVAGTFSTLDLSRGQRKRLALLTALLEDRPVYVFDEWAADQDREFKEIFYLDLLPRLREAGKVVLVVTHDDAYYAVADHVVRLENGRIADASDESATAAASSRTVRDRKESA